MTGRVMAVELGEPVEGNGFEAAETLRNADVGWALVKKAAPGAAPLPDPGEKHLPLVVTG